ncbi:MAG: hypothetical protein JWR34_7182 [Mycobacterium sp.]|nr:hypothetical protein [Mycobacterium sp.]
MAIVCVYTRLLNPHHDYQVVARSVAAARGMVGRPDLATVAATALDVVFSFLDHLCGMLAFEAILDKDEVLKLTEYTVIKDGRDVAARIRQMIGSRDIAPGGLQPVYPPS